MFTIIELTTLFIPFIHLIRSIDISANICEGISVLNSKAQTLTYIECRINASVGTNVIKSDTIIDGHIPENRGYIPVVIGHSNSNDCFDYIFYDGGRWLVRTDIAQRLNIRFYKCIK